VRRRRRTIGLVALALALPLPAYALTQDEPAGPASLSVSASLDSCGVSGSQVLCKIDVSFETIAGATSYTASVTSPDGSVTDLGTVPAGGTTAYVPYVGNGTYNVRVSAYGSPPENGGEPELLETDSSEDAASSRERDEPESVKSGPARPEGEAEAAGEPAEPELAPEAELEPEGVPEASECEAEPVPPEPVPVPELTPEEQAAVDEDAARVAAGEPSTLDPAIAEKLATIEAAEAENAAAAAAPPAEPCPAP